MENGTATALSPGATRRRQLLADAALVGVTFIWGSTFVLVKDIIEQVPPFIFLAARFTIGAAVLALAVLVAGRWRGLSLRELGWGSLIGIALWTGYAFQTIGLQFTSASNAGFITGLSVVLVPVLGLFVLRQRAGGWALLGVTMATVGLALLSLRIEEGVRVNQGDALVLVCAFAFAMQIVLVARVAGWADPLRLTMVQLLVTGVLNALAALLFAGPVAGIKPEIWAGIAFLGIVGSAVVFVIQVAVQRFTTAVHTALIFTLEPVFAAIFGAWLQGDRLGSMGWVGATLILSGMLLAELGPYIKGRVVEIRARGQSSI
jgi:drug/metabolite transporter (DMT)-like permease